MYIGKFIRGVFFFLSPFFIVVPFYFLTDPFKVLRNYDSYYQSGGKNEVNLNKDFISTQNFINKNPAYQYNAFIFGNSRSIFYEIKTWSELIHEPEAKCYHFDGSGESLYGIADKFVFLEKQQVSIKHALIVLDYALIAGQKNPKEYFRLQHPTVSNKSSFAFQFAHLKAFLNFKFVKGYIDLFLSGKVKPYMRDEGLFDNNPLIYDSITNEIKMDYLEKEILEKQKEYYLKKSALFYQRDSMPKQAGKVIYKAQEKLCKTIKRILDQNNTTYEIVISPLYDQLQLNKEDLFFLEQLFGKERVHDFSGINEFTIPVTNYYEISHYRPQVTRTIMKTIYSN